MLRHKKQSYNKGFLFNDKLSGLVVKPGQSWSSYWATLISATVEDAATDSIILTFPTAKRSISASDFSINGRIINSGSWTGSVLTLVLSEDVMPYDANFTLTFLKSGGITTVINNVSYAQIGTIIDDNFARASLGFNYDAVTPKSTITLDGSKLNWAHSLYTSWGDYILWKDIITLERWQAELTFKPSEKSGVSWGLGIRVLSHNSTFKYDTAIQLFTSNVAGYQGSIAIYNNEETVVYKSADVLTITAGHSYYLKCKRIKNAFEIYAKNLNDNSEVSYTYTWPITYSQAQILPNMCKIGIFTPGSDTPISYDVTNFKISSEAISHPKTTHLGDSISVGYYSGANNTRLYELLFGTGNTMYNLMASAGDKISDVVARKEEIVRYKSKYLLIMIGTNDHATDHGVWQTAYEGFLDYLINNEITPIICYVIPRNDIDMRWCNTIIDTMTTARSLKKIDVFTPLKTGDYSLSATYDSGDHLHPNAAGHDVLYDTILAAAPELV